MKRLIVLSYFFLFAYVATSQSTIKMDFEKYDPPSTLVVQEHKVQKSKFPFIDIHNHQSNMSTDKLKDLVKEMDKLNMKVMVNLSGQSGEKLKQSVINSNATAQGRFIVFANIDFKGIGESGWTEEAVQQLEVDVKNGANGLKNFQESWF